MRNNVLLFGLGRMGECVAYNFHKLGYGVISVDPNKNMATEGVTAHFSTGFEDFLENTSSIIHDVDIVFSTMPYHANEGLFSHLVNIMPYNFLYGDLGGNVEVSDFINSVAKEKGISCLTDVGLAPGLVNVIAEIAYQDLSKIGDVDNISMYCGGLPACPAEDDPMKYCKTWSVDGLVNEYSSYCVILEDEDIKIVKALEGKEEVSVNGLELEAFYTSGGISHTALSMQDRGVRNTSYKTLRYKGHKDLITSFPKIEDSQILFREYPDVVHIKVHATGKNGMVQWNSEKLISPKGGFTAMQRATSIGAVAAMVTVDKKSGPSTYEDISLQEFCNVLDQLEL